MKDPSDRLEPFTSVRRRAIGQACRDAPRTRTELGRQLGVDPGSLETVLQSLQREGVLKKTDVRHARAEGFQVRPKWRRLLDRATEGAHPPGLLTGDLRLLILGAGAGLAEALAAAATDPVVVWACRVDGRARIVLAVDGSSSEQSDQVDRLESIVASANVDCIQIAVSEVMPKQRLVQHARTVSGRPHPELGAGA